MRFIHTSDWHLGRSFHGFHLTNDQAYVLDQFIKLVSDTKPDAVVIAGDIYDRSVPPTEAVELLDDVLSRIMLDYKTPVIVIAGNHDSPERLGFGNKLLARQGLHVVGPLSCKIAPIILTDDYGPVYFLPLTYAEPAVVRERLDQPQAMGHEQAMQTMIKHLLGQVPADARKVAIAHAFITGGEKSESERFLTVGGVETVNSANFVPFNYTALGHLHKPQTMGQDTIRYSGSLMKYSFAEANQPKGIHVVDLNGTGNVCVDTVRLTPRRDVRCIEGFMEEILKGPLSGESKEDYIRVVLKDKGAILDPIGRLRQVYPNILDLARPELTPGNQLQRPEGDHRRMTETDLFASFFQQVTGEEISEEQAAEFASAVDELYRAEREV